MSNGNGRKSLLQELVQFDPPGKSLYNDLIQVDPPSVEQPSLIQALGEHVVGAFDLINTLVNPMYLLTKLGLAGAESAATGNMGAFKQAAIEPALLGTGVVEGAVDPFTNLADIPGQLAAKAGMTEVAAGIFTATSKTREGLVRLHKMARGLAEESNLPPQMINTLLTTGNMIGFVAPLHASISVANKLLTTKAVIGGPARDILAGAIYGFGFREGDFKERIYHSVDEGAIFGGISIATLGLGASIKTLRNHRVFHKNIADALEERMKGVIEGIDDAGRPMMEFPDGQTAKEIFEILSEEFVILNSPTAIKMLAKSADVSAVVAAMQDVYKYYGTHVAVRGLASDLSEIAPRLREVFPGAKFDFVRNPTTGSLDVFVGSEGLSNVAKKQIALEGYYRGQFVRSGDKAYEYVRRIPDDPKWTAVRTLDSNKATRILTEDLQDVGFGIPLEMRTPAATALADEFLVWLEGKTKDVAQRLDKSPTDIVTAIRNGEMKLDEFSRRPLREGLAPTQPEHVGITPQPVLEDVNAEIIKRGLEDSRPLDPRLPATFESLVELFMRESSLAGRDAEAFRGFASLHARRSLYKTIPPEERAIFEKLEEDVLRVLNKEGMSLEGAAANAGMEVVKGPAGKITLRDSMTGGTFIFSSEEAAIEGLKGVNRKYLETGERELFSQRQTPGHLQSKSYYTDDFTIPDDAPLTASLRDIIPKPLVTNLRDALKRIEEATGLPFFTRVFDELNLNMRLAEQHLLGWDKLLSRATKGVHKRKTAIKIGEYYLEMDGSPRAATLKERRSIARDLGLSSDQFKASEEMLKITDFLEKELGLEQETLIKAYYSKEGIQATMSEDALALVMDRFPGGIDAYKRAFRESLYTSELPQVDLDPRTVIVKWYRAYEFNRWVGPSYKKAKAVAKQPGINPETGKRKLPFGLDNLPPNVQKEWITAFGGADNLHLLRSTLDEHLNMLRGGPRQGAETVRRISSTLMQMLGVKPNPRVMEQAAYTLMSLWYGGTLGMRPMLLSRQMVQNIWFTYSRIGTRFMGESLEMALTEEGYAGAVAKGWIDVASRGAPATDAIFQATVEATKAEATGLRGMLPATMITAGVKAGRPLRSVSRHFINPYGRGADGFNRTWAGWWQRMNSEYWLGRLEAKKISREKFIDESLVGYGPKIEQEFFNRLKRFGKDDALDYIGRMAADENHFIYGSAAQPPWTYSTAGKFGSMFTAWPMWAKEMYLNRTRYMSPRQKARFWARTGAVTTATALTGWRLGIDLTNWFAVFSPLRYTGPPAVDMAVQFVNAVSATTTDPVRASQLWQNLASELGTISFPGYGVYRDALKASAGVSPQHSFFAFMLGRPDIPKDNWFSWMMEHPAVSPTTEEIGFPSLPTLGDQLRESDRQGVQ